jgi:hypothetical protein
MHITGLNEDDLDLVKIEAKRNMTKILKLLFAKILEHM